MSKEKSDDFVLTNVGVVDLHAFLVTHDESCEFSSLTNHLRSFILKKMELADGIESVDQHTDDSSYDYLDNMYDRTGSAALVDDEWVSEPSSDDDDKDEQEKDDDAPPRPIVWTYDLPQSPVRAHGLGVASSLASRKIFFDHGNLMSIDSIGAKCSHYFKPKFITRTGTTLTLEDSSGTCWCFEVPKFTPEWTASLPLGESEVR